MVQTADGLKAFTHVLEVIADNKLILGDRLVEIGLGAPTIEASTSAIAMAQGELGHARVLYNWVFDLLGCSGTKPEIRSQTGKAFQGVTEAHDWISLVAALYIVDISQDLVLRNFLEQRKTEVATRIHKLIKEQKEHILYAQGWAVSMLNEKGSIPRRFNQALDNIIPDAESWLLQIEQSAPLLGEGYISRDANLAGRFNMQVEGLRAKGEPALC